MHSHRKFGSGQGRYGELRSTEGVGQGHSLPVQQIIAFPLEDLVRLLLDDENDVCRLHSRLLVTYRVGTRSPHSSFFAESLLLSQQQLKIFKVEDSFSHEAQ